MIPIFHAQKGEAVPVTLSRLVALALFALATHANAQQFPAKPIRLILPFPTGPGFVIGQVLTEGLRDTFKHGVISEPRSGGGGSIALETVARSAPDGHTLL